MLAISDLESVGGGRGDGGVDRDEETEGRREEGEGRWIQSGADFSLVRVKNKNKKSLPFSMELFHFPPPKV